MAKRIVKAGVADAWWFLFKMSWRCIADCVNDQPPLFDLAGYSRDQSAYRDPRKMNYTDED